MPDNKALHGRHESYLTVSTDQFAQRISEGSQLPRRYSLRSYHRVVNWQQIYIALVYIVYVTTGFGNHYFAFPHAGQLPIAKP